MKIKKIINAIIHPNKTKRAAENNCNDQIAAVKQQALAQKEVVAAHKANFLISIDNFFSNARQELDTWYQDQLLMVIAIHNQRQNDYNNVLNRLMDFQGNNNQVLATIDQLILDYVLL